MCARYGSHMRASYTPLEEAPMRAERWYRLLLPVFAGSVLACGTSTTLPSQQLPSLLS